MLATHFSVKVPRTTVVSVVADYDRLFNSINETLGKNLDTFEIILIILHNLGVDTKTVSIESLERFYSEMEVLFLKYHPVLIDPNTIRILAYLKEEGLSLNILSNTAFIKGRTVNKILQKLSIADYFDFCIYSDEIGFSKPSNEAYNTLLTSIQAIQPVSRNQVLHIGDNVTADYEGAKKFGFHAQLITVNGKTLSNLFLD